MVEQLFDMGTIKVLSYCMAFFLVCNLIYVIYTFATKKTYYDSIFITCTIYFSALMIEPIGASIKFNSKYGYEVVDLFYFGMIVYIIMLAIFRNNNYFMYNMQWENFYSEIKEIFRRKEIDTYYRQPTIYLGNAEASISHSLNLFSKKVIIVRFQDVDNLIDISEIKAAFAEIQPEERISRYYYLFINIILTIILLVNIRY